MSVNMNLLLVKMFHQKKIWKKLQQSKDLNILCYSENLKSKLVLQKNSTKSLIKRKNKLRGCAKSNLVYSKDFNFYKYHSTIKFAKSSFYSKQNDLNEFILKRH